VLQCNREGRVAVISAAGSEGISFDEYTV